MNKQGNFFSKNHSLILSIATWAKFLAWVVLIISILYAMTIFIQQKAFYQQDNGIPSAFINLLKADPLYGVKLVLRALTQALNGFALFLVLKGISLGLNMIVETDINYREKKVEVEND